MKIALTVDPELPVPPLAYGGIERIIDILARGLVDRGHEVVMFAHPESKSVGKLVPWPGRVSTSRLDILKNAATLARHIYEDNFDFLHSHSRLAYLMPLVMHPIPKLMTYHRAIDPWAVRKGSFLFGRTLEFTALSSWMVENVSSIGTWHIVPNGVPLQTYSYSPGVAADAPFVFLGRIEKIKGPHLAIEIAKRLGRKLIIAGNVPDEHMRWFQAHIAPHVDGNSIVYIGPVDDQQKSELLRSAAALLMPILWEEPFGLVVIEAMACGTPVLGLRRGALPEIIIDGVTGFLGDNLDDLVCMAAELPKLKRKDCRLHVETRFSADAVVEKYLAAYASHKHQSV